MHTHHRAATNKSKHRKHVIVKIVICHSVSVPQCIPLPTHSHLQMFIAVSLFRFKTSLWLLRHRQYRIFLGTPPRYPVVALCYGAPAALDQQDWSFHSSQLFSDDIDFVVGHLRSPWIWAWVGVELLSLPALPNPHQPEQAMEHYSS